MERKNKGKVRTTKFSYRLFPFVVLFIMSCNNSAVQNYDDLKKIKVGMSIKEVRKIMRNQPIEEREVYHNTVENGDIIGYKKDTLYMMSYKSVFGSSDDYNILITLKDSTVKKVYFGH